MWVGILCMQNRRSNIAPPPPPPPPKAAPEIESNPLTILYNLLMLKFLLFVLLVNQLNGVNTWLRLRYSVLAIYVILDHMTKATGFCCGSK